MPLLGPEDREHVKVLGRHGAIGVELVVASLLGLFGGRWLDDQWGTGPWLSLVGFLLGLVAGGKSLYVLARQTTRDPDPDSHHDRSD